VDDLIAPVDLDHAKQKEFWNQQYIRDKGDSAAMLGWNTFSKGDL